MSQITLTATTRFGLEAIVKRELTAQGYRNLKVSNGRIDVEATIEDIPKLNLWLRCSDRIFIKYGEFHATSFDELFKHTKALSWENIIPEDGQIIVNGNSVKSELKSVRSCQSVINKAIIERLKDKYNTSSLREAGSEFRIHFSILKNVVIIAIDTSGTGLHKRGYRRASGEAPLKETLAAALVLLSSWGKGRSEDLLIDPLCGSGTILIEAAMIGRNIAPGLRRRFVSEDWPLINDTIWQKARDDAMAAVKPQQPSQIEGYDINIESIQICKTNAALAGVEHDISFGQKDIKDLWIDRQFGTVITNPPYGRRMAELKELNSLYRTLNNMFKKKLGWSIFVLTADQMFPRYFKRSRPDRVRKLYNGNIKVNYYQYYASEKPTERA